MSLSSSGSPTKMSYLQCSRQKCCKEDKNKNKCIALCAHTTPPRYARRRKQAQSARSHWPTAQQRPSAGMWVQRCRALTQLRPHRLIPFSGPAKRGSCMGQRAQAGTTQRCWADAQLAHSLPSPLCTEGSKEEHACHREHHAHRLVQRGAGTHRCLAKPLRAQHRENRIAQARCRCLPCTPAGRTPRRSRPSSHQNTSGSLGTSKEGSARHGRDAGTGHVLRQAARPCTEVHADAKECACHARRVQQRVRARCSPRMHLSSCSECVKRPGSY